MNDRRRIAVVGAGPKGLYCLERLAIELSRNADPSSVEVHIFEPHPYPGAGPVYDPSQPAFLRMNFANGKIDMWSRTNTLGEIAGLSFVEYLDARGINSSATDYAPRRLVGEYLHDGFARVLDVLRSTTADVLVHREPVHKVERSGDTFHIRTAERLLACNEVLLATGHGSRTSAARSGVSPYPVGQPGGLVDIESGAAVAVRGLGLTAIDVALALTEGRGGRFHRTEVPGHFTYEQSGQEARKVFPYSRTGRPMTPKPHPGVMPDTDGMKRRFGQGTALLDAVVDSGTNAYTAVLDVLLATSASVLALATVSDQCDVSLSAHLHELLERRPLTADETMSEMRAGVEISMGLRSPGPDWALGATWRGIYPALVRLVAARRLDDCWSRFSALAVEMERVAFGPPVENAARFLALVEAGIVDMAFAADPEVIDSPSGGALLRASADTINVDVVVNAVLDPPGAAPDPAPVVGSLLEAGLARPTAHSAGLDVASDGTCIGAGGEPTIGLAAVGRPTEGSILGNDTLSRTLHDTPELWAKSVSHRARRKAETSAT